MTTPASKGKSVGSSKNSSSKNKDDEGEDDAESVGIIRSNNESPERRTMSSPITNKKVNASTQKLSYSDYLDTEDFVRSLVENHIKHGSSTPVLFTMALGFPEYDKMLENPPFSETRKKQFTKHFRPTNQMMMHEVQRRAHFIAELTPDDEPNPFKKFGKIVLPKPAQWSREKLIKWLKENLLEWKLSDLAYMQQHIGAYKTLLRKTLHRV
jgi:hypothetical protein